MAAARFNSTGPRRACQCGWPANVTVRAADGMVDVHLVQRP